MFTPGIRILGTGSNTKNRVRQVTTTFSGEYAIFHMFSETSDIKTFWSIYYPLIILKTWHKPSTLMAKTMCQFISVVNIAKVKMSKSMTGCFTRDPILIKG
jgi:DNA gyrase inhibitor GyrI